LILLLFFGTGCWPAKLVNTKKKRKDNISFDNNNFKGVNNNDILAVISKVKKNIRHFNAICYKDIRLLVVRSSKSKEQDVLVIKVIIAYYKRHKRHLKL
jgi:hypothetical protein